MKSDPITLLNIYKVLDDNYEDLGWYPGENDTEKIVGMILVQNSYFNNVKYSINNLKEHLSIEGILSLDTEELQEKISPSGFYIQKSSTIQDVFNLIRIFGGIDCFKKMNPNIARKSLLSIKGIGDETADVILLYILNSKRFISDSYARRLFGRCLGVDFKNYNDMMDVSEFYEAHLTITQLQQFHAVIDEFGSSFCKKKPKCFTCPLQQICSYNVQIERVK